MGRIVKQISPMTTRYYWYPGEGKEWARAGVAFGIGAGTFVVLGMLTKDVVAATVAGTSATAGVAGVNFGRRDARALAGFPDLADRAARRATIVHTGRAAWRAVAEGVGGAGAAVLIANLPDRGWAAHWLLPLVPAVVGALAHQGGMLWEKAGKVSAPVTLPEYRTAGRTVRERPA